MTSNNTPTLNGRMFRIGLLAVLAVALLAGGAFLWGNRLTADTSPANANMSPAASASRYGSSLGISAVRSADASESSRISLRGVAAVRAIERVAGAPTSVRTGAETQRLSNLELRRSKSQTSAVQAREAADARYAAMDTFYGAKTATAVLRARDADAARYAAMNVFYGAKD